MRIRGALEEEPALGERGAQRRQRPRDGGLVVLAQDIDGADHADAFAARERKVEAAVAESQAALDKRLGLRPPPGSISTPAPTAGLSRRSRYSVSLGVTG